MREHYPQESYEAAETLDRILSCPHDDGREVVEDMIFCGRCRGLLGFTAEPSLAVDYLAD